MDKGKRGLQPDGRTGAPQTPSKKQRNTPSKEQELLSEIKEIMSSVEENLPETELNNFLRAKICELKTEKELVGVIGRTGSGKSSLINAVIRERNLLPSGNYRACTAVIIKVEANMKNKKYEAEIEFIPLKDAEDVLGNLKDTALAKDENPGSVTDATQQLLGLFGENWEQICSQPHLMNKKYFKQIPEIFTSKKKTVAFPSAGELSKELIKYTKTFKKWGEEEKSFSPLVKCVTVRVPNNDFLQNVTLMDLPGTEDNNKTRNDMWKGEVGRCSTVWIVSNIERGVDEKEPWEILEHISSLIGNLGQCQRIHFICTKTDITGDSDDPRAEIFERNKEAKKDMITEFNSQTKLQNHFPEECVKVFTVSAKEFQMNQYLNPEETEIPRLQDFLQSLNNCHPEILNYAHDAKGILSLIQGARTADVSGNEEAVCRELVENLAAGQEIIHEAMQDAKRDIDSCLCEGVTNSLRMCDDDLKSFLNDRDPHRLHRTLNCIVKNGGAYITKKGENLDLNEKLASRLKESIDEKFSTTFPNLQKDEPFRGSIKCFSLETGPLAERFQHVTGMTLRLHYLETEEEQMKMKLYKTIRDRKKLIFKSLVTAIEDKMGPCYDEASKCKGKGALEDMKTIILEHFQDQKDVIFVNAKEKMMLELQKLMDDIKKILNEHMKKAIEHSLKTNELLPDVSQELEKVTEYYNQLKEKQTLLLRSPEGAGPSNA